MKRSSRAWSANKGMRWSTKRQRINEAKKRRRNR